MNTVKLRSDSKYHTAFSNVSQSEISNNDYKKIIFLFHGFPDDNTSFDEIVPRLLKLLGNEKVLILVPMMRGYEPSCQHSSDSAYKVSQLAKDVFHFITENLDYDKNYTKIHLIGHDWGAIACFKAASMYPDLIDSIATLAIPYLTNLHLWDYAKVPEQLYMSSYFLTMQWKYFYLKLESQHSENSYLNYLWEYWSPNWNYPNSAIENVRKTLQKGSTIDHVTAYYRCILNPLYFRDTRWHVDFNKVPTLLLGGRNDGCMSYKLYELEMDKLKNEPNAKVQILSNVGHFLHREDPTKVSEILADWIQSQP